MNFSSALNELNLFTNDQNKKSLSYMLRNMRKSFNHILLVVIPFYIYTTDDEGEEGHLDLVQNFTALYIMCDIDQLLTLPSQLIDNYTSHLTDLGPRKLLMFRFSKATMINDNDCVKMVQGVVGVASLICVFVCKFMAFFFLPISYFVAIMRTRI